MSICKVCGIENTLTASSCSVCGSPLTASRDEVPRASVPSPATTAISAQAGERTQRPEAVRVPSPATTAIPAQPAKFADIAIALVARQAKLAASPEWTLLRSALSRGASVQELQDSIESLPTFLRPISMAEIASLQTQNAVQARAGETSFPVRTILEKVEHFSELAHWLDTNRFLPQLSPNVASAQAAKLYTALTMLAPDDFKVWDGLASASLRANDDANALKAANWAIEVANSQPSVCIAPACLVRASVLTRTGDLRNAMRAVNAGLKDKKVEKETRDLLLSLKSNLESRASGRAIRFLDENDEAIVAGRLGVRDVVEQAFFLRRISDSNWNDMAKRNPSSEPSPAKQLGWSRDDALAIAERVYDWADSASWVACETGFRALSIVVPFESYMPLMLGVTLAKLERSREAIEEYSTSLALSPSTYALTNRGELYLYQGKFDLAREDLTAAVKHDKKGDDSHALRARALLAEMSKAFKSTAAQKESGG